MAYTPGPFDNPHLYLQWGGKLPGSEQWSCGVRLHGSPSTVVADAASLMASYVAPIQAFHVAVATQIATTAKLSYVKLNAIGTNGKYMVDTTNLAPVADVGGGVSAGAAHPNQVALAVSLTTGFSRGPAHRGRFFLPMPVIAVASDGLISASDRTNVTTTATTLLTALNAVAAGWKVHVMSRKSGAPAHRAVTGIQVGRVLDTQRRRRRSLVENY